MKIKCYWWVDNGDNTENKLSLRKKFAEFNQLELEECSSDIVTVAVSKEDLFEVLIEGIAAIEHKDKGWIWIGVETQRQEIPLKKLAQTITSRIDTAVYGLDYPFEGKISVDAYQEIKKKILMNELPVYCIEGSTSLVDDKVKIVILFWQNNFIQNFFLKTDNLRFGYIIRKELQKDRHLATHINVEVQENEKGILLIVSLKEKTLLERATNVLVRKANEFKLSVFKE
ncbi:MAG: hypothetical protein SCK28_01435 [Bacillota bacterium]|nr:hypothetical protein [Bacillota bacterium]